MSPTPDGIRLRRKSHPSFVEAARCRREWPSITQRIPGLVEHCDHDEDPMAALRALTELRHQLDLFEREQVARALKAGRPSRRSPNRSRSRRQAAHRRYRDLAPPRLPAGRRRSPRRRAPPSSAPARRRPARAPSSIESEHLLVAVARTGVLSLDIEAARRTLGPPVVARAPSPPACIRPCAPASAARTARSSSTTCCARPRGPGGGARRLLERLGIPPQAVLDAL